MRTQNRHRRLVVVVQVLAFVLLPSLAAAAPGELDTTFAGDGVAETDFFGLDDNATAVTAHGDGSGRTLVVGSAFNGANNDVAISSYTPAGLLDSSFGGDGRVTFDFGSIEVARAVAVQPNDGKILVAFSKSMGLTNLIRVLPGGTLDTAFSDAGKLAVPFAIQDIALRPDGRIVLGGTTNNDFAIGRFNSDGSPDTSLDADGDADGVVVTNSNFGGQVNHIALLENDGILAVGTELTSTGSNTSQQVALLRHGSTGSLDTTFGTGGKRLYDFNEGEGEWVGGVAVQSSGRIVVATGTAAMSGDPFLHTLELLGFTAQGGLDPTFGTQGVSRRSALPSPGGMTLLSDDRIVVAAGGGITWKVGRYLANGSLDQTFGERSVGFSGTAVANDVTLSEGGDVIVAGSAPTPSTNRDFAVGRFDGGGSSEPPPGQSNSDDQTTTVDVTTEEGVLVISVAQQIVDFGSLQAGTTSAPKTVGNITYTNTLGSGQPWSATVAATALTQGANTISYTNMKYTPGSTITPSGSLTPGAGTGSGNFTGSGTFSNSAPLMTAPSSAQGDFTQSGGTATLTVPGGTAAVNDYQGTLQYTLFG